MQLFYGVPEDIEKWMSLVAQVRWNFPGLSPWCCYNAHDGKETFDYAETLAEPIQRFADVLEKELKKLL